ncbi:helix-turn-helix domain-containing protein [Cellulomonas sp. Leaf395]|uniref:helix-turn-helix domain-containing protein n=1 Tax=Cellulomonas sp. Leaf395 TaxID=1736362 RepID=UPI0009E8D765|nr:helix-turn-helix domain-containing protein [Cellulomonas sp. Leaf395]
MSLDQSTLTPEEVAQMLGASPWWVREQARRGRVPHLRLGRGRIRFLPEHFDALVKMVTVQVNGIANEPPASQPVDLRALGATSKSIRAHQNRPHVQGDVR